jgi:mannose-6-phosphate isomerase-like protein (cupin superfamily)
MTDFKTKRLPATPDEVAPDGSEVRVLLGLRAGLMGHYTLPPRETSTAIANRTIEEIWFFLSGRGEMWRKQNQREEIVTVETGTSVTIPLGTHFQFRCLGDEPLVAVGITMPPWPGPGEASVVKGKWAPTAFKLNGGS